MTKLSVGEKAFVRAELGGGSVALSKALNIAQGIYPAFVVWECSAAALNGFHSLLLSNHREHGKRWVVPLPGANEFYPVLQVAPRVPKSEKRKLQFPSVMEFDFALVFSRHEIMQNRRQLIWGIHPIHSQENAGRVTPHSPRTIQDLILQRGIKGFRVEIDVQNIHAKIK